ncbi:GIN domain-containing protein, partial [Chloroflexota bacterium]
FVVSGASHVIGNIEMAEGKIDVSGASSLILDGFASDISVDVSGASHADIVDLSVTNATANISGASSTIIKANNRLNAKVTGASRLTYLGNPMLDIETSGGSTVDHDEE